MMKIMIPNKLTTRIAKDRNNSKNYNFSVKNERQFFTPGGRVSRAKIINSLPPKQQQHGITYKLHIELETEK